MSTRAAPSGINRDIQRKKDQNYPRDKEIEARQWIETILEQPLANQTVGKEGFSESLKNGVVLCELMNKLQPGSIKKINTSSMVFKQMENISNFLKAVEAYGVPNMCIFQTVDLFEARDVGAVVLCLFNLGGCATKKGYEVPWGIARKDPNQREFSEETLAAGKTIRSQQSGYTQGASQAGSGGFGNTRRL